MCDCLSPTNDDMSSANVTNFISFPSTLIPFIRKLLWIEIDNNSRTMMKRGRINFVVVNAQLHYHFRHYRG